MRKRAKFLSNCTQLDPCFSSRCSSMTCNRDPVAHAWLQGQEGGCNRTRAAQVYPPRMCRNLALTVEREWYHAGAQQMVAGPAGDNDSTESDWELRSEGTDDGYRGPAVPNQQQKPAEKKRRFLMNIGFRRNGGSKIRGGRTNQKKLFWSERGPWRLNRRIRAAKFWRA